MTSALDILIIHNNDGIRNAVKRILLSRNDNRIWAPREVDYKVIDEVTDSGNKFLKIDIKFYNVSDRDQIFNAIKGIGGIIHDCLPGSYIGYYECGHDEGKPCDKNSVHREYAQ